MLRLISQLSCDVRHFGKIQDLRYCAFRPDPYRGLVPIQQRKTRKELNPQLWWGEMKRLSRRHCVLKSYVSTCVILCAQLEETTRLVSILINELSSHLIFSSFNIEDCIKHTPLYLGGVAVMVGLLGRCWTGGDARLGELMTGADDRFWMTWSLLRSAVRRPRMLCTTKSG